jgi:hypothetical protein
MDGPGQAVHKFVPGVDNHSVAAPGTCPERYHEGLHFITCQILSQVLHPGSAE